MGGLIGESYRPSSADRWATCTASVKLIATMPHGPSSKESREGTLAHAVWAASVEARRAGQPYHPDLWVGETFQHTEVTGETWEAPMPADMAEPLDECHRYLDSVVQHHDGIRVLLSEQRVAIDLGIIQEKGTADLVAVMADGTVHVFDLKYGRGVYVEAMNNAQLCMYGIGVAQLLGRMGITGTRYVFHIMLPRQNSMTRWELTPDELQAWVASFHAAVHEAKHAPVFRPSDKACKWCPAKNLPCPAMAEHVHREVAMKFIIGNNPGDRPLKPDDFTPPSTYSRGELANMWNSLDLIRTWCTTLEKTVNDALEADPLAFEGHLKRVAGDLGARFWADEKTAIDACRRGKLTKDAYTKTSIISPTEFERAVGKTSYTAIIKHDEVKRKPGNPRVVPWSDKRPPLGGPSSAEKFGIPTPPPK